MKKRLLLAWLCAVITVGLLTLTAYAGNPVLHDLVVTGGTEGTDYEWRDSQLVILTDTPVSVRNLYAAETVTQTILISRNVSANVTLNGVNIGATGGNAAVQIDGTSGNVTITLKGENRLTGGAGRAAIEKSGTDGNLTITGDGSLYAHGGNNAPGIGSLSEAVAIEFAGGSVTAVCGNGASTDIGTVGSNPAKIRIASTAAVKGDFSSRPEGTNGKRIGQLVLDNPGEMDVTVDGTLLPYRVNPDDAKLTLWLPVGEHQIDVGGDSRFVPVSGDCGLKVTGGTEGTDYIYSGEDLIILTSTPMTVSNTDPSAVTGDMIYISGDVDADLTLNGVNIDNVGALRIADDSRGNVQLRLAEGSENTLRASRGAGIQKNGANGSLTISGKGKLEVYGGGQSAGIGGGITYDNESDSRETANITITDGTVTVYSGSQGAGIGGGLKGDADNLTITGGFVEAYSGGDGAGIGSGAEASVGSITISGGTVIAHARNAYGAAIGGNRGTVKKITISGGTVTAYSGGGTAIGPGSRGSVELIEITGGTVNADSGAGASAIGAGYYGTVDSIRISGGTVKAYYAWNRVAIGSGEEGHVGEIAITGGTVTLENSSPEWDDPATDWFALGSDNKDDINIIIKNCLLTADGGIGCRNGGNLSVVIGKNASVRTAALHAQAVNESGEPVYPLLIENPLEKRVMVGGEAFPYITHPGEKALCPYRPGREISVTVESETNIIPFDQSTLSFGASHIPAAERINVQTPTCTRDGYTGDLYCLGCGDLIEKGESIPCPGHDCTVTVIREATLTKPGEVQMHCKVCGANFNAAQRCIGDFIVSGIESDGDVSFSGGVLTVLKNRTLMIQNIRPNEPTTARIAIADGVTARLILNGVCIDSRSVGGAAISMADGNSGDVRIELANGSVNQLYSGSECAGLQKNGGHGTLTITGSGTLIAVGGSGAAGIGSAKGHLMRNLTIENGHISAAGGTYGAGIGSGQNFSAENIRITGGMITAFGGTRAHGIGHGYNLFGFTDTENLVIGSMASVKADGPYGALGTTPVNENGERVFLRRYGIPENSYLQIDRQRFPYTYHDGEARVYVYLTPAQTADPHAEGGTQLQGGTRTAGVLMTPSVKANENAKMNLTVADAAGLDELAAQYADEGKTVVVTMTIEETDGTVSADALRKKAGRSAVECFGITLTKQADGNEPGALTGDTPVTLTIPFDYEGVDADSVCVLRYLDHAEKLLGNPADGEEGYTLDSEAGTIQIALKRVSDFAVAYNLTEEPPLNHDWGDWKAISATQHQRVCGNDPSHVETAPHSFSGNTCVDCGYTPVIYTLTFNTNGGSAISSVSGIYGLSIGVDTFVPTKDGYDFGGWFTDPALTNPVDEIKLTGNKTVYAKWVIRLPFTDVPETDWSYEDIAYVYEKGLMQGTSETTFAPQLSASRAMIVTILWRLEGKPVVDYAMSFKDVADDQWYTEAIRWAQANGIVNGYSAEKFDSDAPITREQMAAIFYRYAAFKGYDVSARADLSAFADLGKVDTWAADSVAWANAVSLVNGVSDTELDPLGLAERGQVAAILHRFCENTVK